MRYPDIRFFICILLFLFFFLEPNKYLRAQEKQEVKEKESERIDEDEKATYQIEEEVLKELGEKQVQIKQSKESSEETDIIIQGEDELLIKSHKDSTHLFYPERVDITTWDEKTKKQAEPRKKKQKTGQFVDLEVSYGQYHNLDVDMSVKINGQKSAHSVLYSRAYQGSEGFNFKGIENSSHSFDQVITSNIFKPFKAYQLMLKAYYFHKLEELQKNPNFTNQEREAWHFEWGNQYQFETQRVQTNLQGLYIRSHAESLVNNPQATYYSFKADAQWEILLKKQSWLIDADVLIAQERVYSANEYNYRAGNLGLIFNISLYSAYVGENAVPWDIFLKAGVYLFLSRAINPLPKPIISLENHLGKWHSKISLSRESFIPDVTNKNLKVNFFKPSLFALPQDSWDVKLTNLLYLDYEFVSKLDIGYRYYNRIYYPSLSNDQLYSYREQRFRFIYIGLRLEHSPFEFWNYAFSLNFEHQLDRIDFRTPIYFKMEMGFIWASIEFKPSLTFYQKRETPGSILPMRTVFNIHLYYWLSDSGKFYLKIENVFNELYIILPPYQTSGVLILGGFQLKI